MSMTDIALPNPGDETARLRELAAYSILDTPAESAFDLIVEMASETLGTPIAIVSIIDHNRQWVKAAIGLSLRETPRHLSVCTHTIEQQDILEIPDLQADCRFVGNPLIAGQPSMGAYLGAPVFSRNGFALGALCVIDDKPREFTPWERKQLACMARLVADEMELRLARRELDMALCDVEMFNSARTQFLCTVSHECFTPLTAIIGALEILKIDRSDTDRSRFVQIAQDAATHLQGILQDVMTTTAIDHDGIDLKRSWFSPDDFIRSATMKFATLAQSKSVDFTLTVGDDLPQMIYTDKTRLRQIVNHLLSNAIKFTSRGSIEVSIQSGDEDNLVVEIIDTGCGFPGENCAHLMQSFTQQEAGLNRSHEGLGLGLSICSRLATLLGGTLQMRSVPNVGSRARLTLPSGGDLLSGDHRKTEISDFRPIALTDLIRH